MKRKRKRVSTVSTDARAWLTDVDTCRRLLDEIGALRRLSHRDAWCPSNSNVPYFACVVQLAIYVHEVRPDLSEQALQRLCGAISAAQRRGVTS